jgi:murein DD-endopeptidase MepM/ murein hydrolase activator NlpD
MVMGRSLARWLLPVVLAFGAVWLAVWRATRPGGDGLELVSGGQADAARLGALARLLPPGVLEWARVPGAAAWSAPLGTANGAFTYNAQPFAVDNPRRGGVHLGDDLNGIGQENSDLDDPVFAVADGLVLYAGSPTPGWGGMVVLGHRDGEGEAGLVQSVYGHLNPASIAVAAGQRVWRGRRLGRLGLAGAMDYAHLHFEIRRGAVVAPGPGYAVAVVADWPAHRDPAAFLAERVALAGLPVAAAARVAAPVRLGGAGGGP